MTVPPPEPPLPSRPHPAAVVAFCARRLSDVDGRGRRVVVHDAACLVAFLDRLGDDRTESESRAPTAPFPIADRGRAHGAGRLALAALAAGAAAVGALRLASRARAGKDADRSAPRPLASGAVPQPAARLAPPRHDLVVLARPQPAPRLAIGAGTDWPPAL